MFEEQNVLVYIIYILLFSLLFIKAVFSFLFSKAALIKQHCERYPYKIKEIMHFFHQFILALPIFALFYHSKFVIASLNTIFNVH